MEYYCLLLLIAANAFITNAFPYDSVEEVEVEDRILGGESVDIKDYPYQVAVNKEGRRHCGGSIISLNFILTAAHCVDSSRPEDYTVRAGSKYSEKGGVTIAVRKIHSHAFVTGGDPDISVLELTHNLPQDNDNIKIIQLAPSNTKLKPGTRIRVSGWGRTVYWNNTAPEILQAVTVPTVSLEECLKSYTVRGDFICTNTANNKGSCMGDSGGPAASEDGKILYGIVSFGSFFCTGSPSVFTNVAAYRDWIKNITGF